VQHVRYTDVYGWPTIESARRPSRATPGVLRRADAPRATPRTTLVASDAALLVTGVPQNRRRTPLDASRLLTMTNGIRCAARRAQRVVRTAPQAGCEQEQCDHEGYSIDSATPWHPAGLRRVVRTYARSVSRSGRERGAEGQFRTLAGILKLEGVTISAEDGKLIVNGARGW